MSWTMTGRLVEACSCDMFCPCWMGPAEPDQGWCSGALVLDIQEGDSDGVNLGGLKAAFLVDLPGDFMGGNGTARVYIDEGASTEQRREIETIFHGGRGGPWAAVGSLIANWLPTQGTSIDLQWGDDPSGRIGDIAQVALQPVKDEAGRQTQIQGAPAMAAFQLERLDLARSNGSRFADREMRQWEAGGSGSTSTFNWRGS